MEIPHKRTHKQRYLMLFVLFCGMTTIGSHFGRYNEPAIRNVELCELTYPKSPLALLQCHYCRKTLLFTFFNRFLSLGFEFLDFLLDSLWNLLAVAHNALVALHIESVHTGNAVV